MDDPTKSDKVDHFAPEGIGPGPEAAGFSAEAQKQESLGGGSGEVKPSQPQQVKKETDWPMGARKSVEVNGKRWEYLEYGNPDGIPILNVHGWLSASAEGNERLSKALAGEVQNSIGLQSLDRSVEEGGTPKGAAKVRALVESLKGKYHIIAPQLPGFGHSEAIDDPFLDGMADALADFQQAVGLEKPIFFGSSMGGILGVKLAARHPEAVRALVIQGTMAEPTDMKTREYLFSRVATFPPIKIAVENIPWLANLAKEKIFKPGIQTTKDFQLATPENRELMLNDVDAADPKTILSTLRGIGSHLERDIDRISAPVIVMDGTAGELVPIAKSKEIAGRFHQESPPRGNRDKPNLGDKIADKKVMYFQVGGVAGEHGHSVINSAPEEVAVLINHAVNYTNAGIT